MPSARISLNLSRHPSLASAGPQVYIPYLHRTAVCRTGRPAFARPCEGVHKSTSLMSSSRLLQQSRMSGSSNFDSFRDEWLVAV